MKKLLSVVLAVALLLSTSFACAAVRPSKEVNVIELYLDTIREYFDDDPDFDLLCKYFENFDIVTAVFSLKHVSRNDLTERKINELKSDLEQLFIDVRDVIDFNLEDLGIENAQVVVFCNTYDYQRVIEVWDPDFPKEEN